MSMDESIDEFLDRMRSGREAIAAPLKSDPKDDLVAAIEQRSVSGVRQALAAGASADTMMPDNYRVLSHAVQCGSPDMVAALLDAGAQVDFQERHDGRDSWHPVAVAVQQDLPTIFDLLMNAKDLGPALERDVDYVWSYAARAYNGGRRKYYSDFCVLFAAHKCEEGRGAVFRGQIERTIRAFLDGVFDRVYCAWPPSISIPSWEGKLRDGLFALSFDIDSPIGSQGLIDRAEIESTVWYSDGPSFVFRSRPGETLYIEGAKYFSYDGQDERECARGTIFFADNAEALTRFVDSRPSAQTQAYFCAGVAGNLEVYRTALQAGCDTNLPCLGSVDVLRAAIWSGNRSNEVIDDLIGQGFLAQGEGANKQPVLVDAAETGDADLIDLLLKRGARLDVKKHQGVTAAMVAAREANWDLVFRLLECGADPDAVDKNGNSVLSYAVKGEGGAKLIENLLAAGLACGNDSISGDLLIDAIQAGRIESTRWLLERGADVNSRGQDGKTPLMIAAEKGAASDEAPMLNLILAHNPDLNAVDKHGDSALHLADWLLGPQCIPGKAAEILLKHGIDSGLKNENGCTALFSRVIRSKGNYTAHAALANLQVMVAASSDLPVADNEGNTPLYAAAAIGCLPAAEILLDAGADVNVARPDGETCLMAAARGGDQDLLRLFIAGGADVHAVDNMGDTALHYAASHGKAESVAVLLEAGAEASVESGLGWTPLGLTDSEEVKKQIQAWTARQRILDVLSRARARPSASPS